jgi:antitoxin ParD1/3/4
MSQGVNVRFAGNLQRFISKKTGEGGLYSSASEYIRDLVRRDYESEEHRLVGKLLDELRPGATAKPAEFVALDAEKLIAEAKAHRKSRGR